MSKQIKFSGIGRNVPQNTSPDGSCQEIINMRYRKGAWRPIPDKVEIHTANFTFNGSPISFSGNNIYLHDIEGGINAGQPNWIGYSGGYLYLIDPVAGTCDQIDACVYTEYFKIVFLKRIMIVTGGTGLQMYLYTKIEDKGAYGKIVDLPTPDVNLSSNEYEDIVGYIPVGDIYQQLKDKAIKEIEDGEVTNTPEEFLGSYYKMVNHQSHTHGRLLGSFMYRSAYRLFDGSYIMHSAPRYVNCGEIISFSDDHRWKLKFGAVTARHSFLYYAPTYEVMKDLVDSIVVFATKVEPLYLVDDTTVTEEMYNRDVPYPRYPKDCFPINPDFKTMNDSEGWYQIAEFEFKDLVGVGSTVKNADTKDFYQDYATRKTLPADQNSHNKMVAKNALVFNDYLHLQNIKTIYGDALLPLEPAPFGYYTAHSHEAILVAYLTTGLGKAVVKTEFNYLAIENTDTQEEFVQINPTVGYPDARCTRLVFAIKVADGDYRLVWDRAMKKNEGQNFAYFQSDQFSVSPSPNTVQNYGTTVVPLSSLTTPYILPKFYTTDFDTNRIQVSEIQNPMVFPAKHSYQVGTGAGIAMVIASEPMSQGNFGQFPLIVFTSKGRYALAQGSGGVLYASVQPVDGEVADNPKNIIGIDSGVIYSTELGLFLAVGMQKTRISELVEGKPITTLTGASEVATLLTDRKYTQALYGKLSKVDFLTYLKTSQIAFDQVNKELIVTNIDPTYGYSYIFSTEYKIWYKISVAYDALINAYPYVYGIVNPPIGGVGHVYNLSLEKVDGYVPVIIATNALSLEFPSAYKKVERMIARCGLQPTTGSYVGMYLFASNDLHTWQFVTGRQRTVASGTAMLQDLVVLRSHGSAKYFALVLNGKIHVDSDISLVDTLVIEKLNVKIR